MRASLQLLASCLAFLTCALAAQADERTNQLLDRLGMSEMVEIMRQEGVSYAEQLAEDMLPGGSTATWRTNVNRIYDREAMKLLVQGGFAKALSGTDISAAEDFFDADLGARIVELEVSARRAMLDEDIEEAAKERAGQLETSAAKTFAQVEQLIEQGDMLEANVVSALNSNILFYRGLVDGGAYELSDAEIVSDVWSQEEEMRKETRDWLFGFFLMAYDPLAGEDLERFIAFSATEAGQTLTRAIFAAYDGMYTDISYALGLAVAQEMRAEDI
ncbi:MAG: hypothetical protein AAF891_05780 [Pseudomonadota bacterium]